MQAAGQKPVIQRYLLGISASSITALAITSHKPEFTISSFRIISHRPGER